MRNVRAGNDVYLLQCEQDNASVELILPPKHSLEEFKKCSSKIMGKPESDNLAPYTRHANNRINTFLNVQNFT